ncbi:putative zinc finger protein 730 isoform X2 [Asterias rubens]|uniref:putative zinc finger protein 730 isoform X2 n=1 Tax=Asterias rubens TaxID=7604 RepID=UPI0014557A55|nr:putative zinc finger protein 730 isoform X2 [Asterias rubens]
MSSLNFKLIRLGSCLHDQWLKEKTLFQTRLNAERHADELLDCDEVSAGDFLDHLLDVHRRMCRVCSCRKTTSNSRSEVNESKVSLLSPASELPTPHQVLRSGEVTGSCKTTTPESQSRTAQVTADLTSPSTQDGLDHSEELTSQVENQFTNSVYKAEVRDERSPIWISDDEESNDNHGRMLQTETSNVIPTDIQMSSETTEGQRSHFDPSMSVMESCRVHDAEQSDAVGSKPANHNQFMCWDCGQMFDNLTHLQQHCNSSNCSQKQGAVINDYNRASVPMIDDSHISSLNAGPATSQDPSTHTYSQDHSETDIPTRAFNNDLGNRFFQRKRRFHTNIKPFGCAICNKTFTQLAALKEHRHVHDDVRQYACSICNKRFKYRSNLYEHRKTSHRVTQTVVSTYQPARVQSISQVSETISSQGTQDLNHTRQLPLEESPPQQAENHPHLEGVQSGIAINQVRSLAQPNFFTLDDPKKYVCDICGRPFAQSNNLKRHRRTHTKEKPYQCDVCLKSFTQSNTMKEHKKIHSDQKAYGCAFCGKRFRQRSSLDKHKKSYATTEDVACGLCGQKFKQKCTLRVHMANHVIFLP